jgi:hypothetical protein
VFGADDQEGDSGFNNFQESPKKAELKIANGLFGATDLTEKDDVVKG